MINTVVTKLLATRDDRAIPIARIALGVVMFPHGAQKVLGWWGGYGLSATLDYFTTQLSIPAPLALAAIGAESLGALGLIFGLGTRVAAFAVGVTMVVAASLHIEHGFFMNWDGSGQGEGYEFHLLAIGIAAALVVRGAGALSLDGWLTRRREYRAR